MLLLFCCTRLNAQDISGIWKGELTMVSGCFPVNNIEIQITKGVVQGNSYHYQDVHYYVKKKLSGNWDAQRKKLVLNEGIVNTFKIPSHCKVCIKNYDLVYSRQGDVETLTGTWNGKIMGTGADCSANGGI